ncbi:MAG: ClpXP protease specificity-enhancing factor [Burkholderiales bacterium]|nr:ClpXP protease specificity-enhancing factor [Burkholderiales bacterium]
MGEPTSTKPYLLRAIYEWCVDNGFTPYIAVVVNGATRVPMEYVREGEIVLNIGPLATSRLQMGNEMIECTARFAGAAMDLAIPVGTVAAIYARENGQGMSFDTAALAATTDEGGTAPPADGDRPDPPRPTPGKPALRRVK